MSVSCIHELLRLMISCYISEQLPLHQSPSWALCPICWKKARVNFCFCNKLRYFHGLGNPIECIRIPWITVLPLILTANEHITQQTEKFKMIAVIIYLVYILKGIPLPKCALHNLSYGAIVPPKCLQGAGALNTPACRNTGYTSMIRCKNASAVIYGSVILYFQTSVRKVLHSFKDGTV
jgi:hypothetical protein